MCISTPKCSMAEAVTGVPRSPALSLSLFSAQGFGNVAICQTANCFCAISKCTFYVLFWSFSVFFFSFRLKGCSPPPSLLGREVLVMRARTDILQFFFPYKQHCCRHSRVCKILVFWSAGFCTVSVICVVVYRGTCTLPTIKFEGGKLVVGWHGLHFLILKVVRQVVLGIFLIYVPQA